MSQLPNCGIYRTSRAIGDIPAEKLVYFHNHGDPGPGLYLPQKWVNNQAQFHERGSTLKDELLADSLEPLMPEGLYRVDHTFYCCKNNCVHFHVNQLVQLGYNDKAIPLLFFPFWENSELQFPTTGTRVDPENLQNLVLLTIPNKTPSDAPMLH